MRRKLSLLILAVIILLQVFSPAVFGVSKNEAESQTVSFCSLSLTSEGAGKTVKNVFPDNPANFKPSGLIKKEYNNGKIIKWQDPKTGKAIYEWNADAKYGDHYHYTPDGKNRATHPDTGDTHIKPGSNVPK